MKRFLRLTLIFFYIMGTLLPGLYTTISADTPKTVQTDPLILPESSSEASSVLAMQLLALGSVQTAQDTKDLLEESGFSVQFQEHYDKSPQDPAHTCAFTAASGTALCGTQSRPVLLVTIRGTSAGEWYSNFDFAPSGSEDPDFAENFLFCAEDVFLSLQDLFSRLPDGAAIVVTGFSRGAAGANLLGLLLNETQDPENVYVYTFACPATVRTEALSTAQDNLFNYLNPADLVPDLPLEQWGYHRAGTDILLPCEDPELEQAAETYAKTLYGIAPSVSDYYSVRHSLTAPGLSETGLTPFEFMLLICKVLADLDLEQMLRDGRIEWEALGTGLYDLPDSFSESDFFLLFETLEDLSRERNGLGYQLLRQHLPSRYAELIALQGQS